MTRDDVERIDALHLQAWNEQDIDGWLALLADGFVWRDVTMPEPITTKEAARRYMEQWFTAFPDMRVTVINRVVGDGAVGAETEIVGTNTGDLSMRGTTLPATGKSVKTAGVYFVTVRDGRMTYFSTHPDTTGLMRQLGLQS